MVARPSSLGFNSRYVFVPVVAIVALVVINYLVTEERRTYVAGLSTHIQRSQSKMAQLGEVIYACADAESAQRGFLLADKPEYLAPFDAAKKKAYSTIDQLLVDVGPEQSAERLELQFVREYMDKKFYEMQVTIDAALNYSRNEQAVAMLKTDVGLEWMQKLRSLISGIQARERAEIDQDIANWSHQVWINRIIYGATALVNLLLVLVVGWLMSRDLRRRQTYAAELKEEIQTRTSELSELSQHLLLVRESEKAELARELHDELGGLLVAIKMDLSQLAKRIDMSRDDVQARWQRIQSALAAGIELKRRVIEDLRPTLLDNMGLLEALRWHAGQVCDQASLALQIRFPQHDPQISDLAATAVFRVVQEALTNIAKHAAARNVLLELRDFDGGYKIIVEDDGIGMAPGRSSRPGAHGLTGMKYRMLSIDGSLDIAAATPRGMRVMLTFPRLESAHKN
ncbi:MAG: CHASE3 domain-containing protein [Pseudomonadota bacterium]